MTDFLDATRTSYDKVAVSYEELLRDHLATNAADRAVLGMFAEYTTGQVADVGCGPGRITAHLASLGLDAFGVDLSPGMVEVARERHRGLRFEVGSMTGLDLPDGALGGVVAWYSVIHVPPELHPEVFAGFFRVLAPGGHLLLAFQAGDERRHITEGYGHQVDLVAYRLPPERIAAQVVDAGFELRTTVVRAPEPPNEKVQQAYLIARKPG
ncbi:methyltransferase domain-containing protein [Actinosynnema sp. NPDC047251]|uniref:Methyltransferase n=1 Tax=Saccharothrix espanaensis (strain ATCC 51144 / DSM 44229 / JCM 9112 / NBRC 15066 / NRRL 15764) TaxID=1179773 RepID=K0KGN2_SACES|nr:class I SAM-dependent methyltransferase [Saccharothrix espanaensis]CCH35673.1 Methyltransferase [Saccharothrix espanaensis DSM 44229]